MNYIPPARIFKILQEQQELTGKSLQTIITMVLEDYYNNSSNSKSIRSQEYETKTKVPSNSD